MIYFTSSRKNAIRKYGKCFVSQSHAFSAEYQRNTSQSFSRKIQFFDREFGNTLFPFLVGFVVELGQREVGGKGGGREGGEVEAGGGELAGEGGFSAESVDNPGDRGTHLFM